MTVTADSLIVSGDLFVEGIYYGFPEKQKKIGCYKSYYFYCLGPVSVETKNIVTWPTPVIAIRFL